MGRKRSKTQAKDNEPLKRKIDVLREFMAAEDWHKALQLAASWPDLGEYKEAIERGWAALSHPEMYKAMKYDPGELVREGIAALRKRYAPDNKS